MADRPAAHLQRLTERDFELVTRLAYAIWHGHYRPIISAAQVDYMLDRRFTAENLNRYVAADDRWMWLAWVDDAAVGYCSCALTATAGEMKLEQLYLLPEWRGRGFGEMMIAQVEACARAHGCGRLMLQVAKRNGSSIALYEHQGFTIERPVVFDIGGGFVMDDYIMSKTMVAAPP